MSQTQPISISISRQLGSGGSLLGKAIAKRLNLTYMDRDIVMAAAKKLGVSYEEIESHDEKFDSLWKSILASFQYGNITFTPAEHVPSDEVVHRAESEVIVECSKVQSILVVGRGANFVLEDQPKHVSIFIHADEGHRIERLKKLFGVSEQDAHKWIHKTDALREEYVLRFTGHQMYDLRHYNLVIDTGVLGLEAAEEAIMVYLKLRFGEALIRDLIENKEPENE